ncbi:MAG: GAF domain-containing protein [Bradymonadia bacterium]
MNHTHPRPLPVTAPESERLQRHQEVSESLNALLDGEDDWISALCTVVCELHHAFEYFHWTGVYRVHPHGHPELIVGPYQGSHGCLRIAFERGVCGAAARERKTIRLDDVHTFPGHIACSSSTVSELVIPILTPEDELLGVLDLDSDHPAAFTAADQTALESLCRALGGRFAEGAPRYVF